MIVYKENELLNKNNLENKRIWDQGASKLMKNQSILVTINWFTFVAVLHHGRDVLMGAREASRTPICSKLQEIWSKVSHAARELVTVFSMTLFFSNSSW